MNSMNFPDMEPDWALWRSFLSVLDHGTLSGAARHLGVSQPSVGRHIEALETRLNSTLFDKSLKGYRPTSLALRLGEKARIAEAALGEARNIAEGQVAELAGTVRITASQVFSHYLLPAILIDARKKYPAIELEIVASDSAESLLLREADIAIRMFRPTQLDLIARHLGDTPIAACAHQSYLDRKGTPTSQSDLSGHDLIGFDRSEQILKAARELGFPLARSDFATRTESQTLMWELIRAGFGMGFAQTILIENTPGMVRLLPQLQIPALPIWLTTHRELFTNARIRAIYDLLANALTQRFGGRNQQ